MFFLSFAVLSFYGELEWHFSKFGQIHIYQTSDRQLYHACVDTDDFWFATANHSDDGRCRRFLAPSPSSPHRGFTINSETEIVQFSGMDSLCLNFDKTLGYLFFDWESSDLFECKLYVLQNKSLTFDLKMLWPTVMAPSSSSAAAAVAVAGEICFSLSSIFYAIKQTIGPELQKPFVLLTGESSSKQRLALWMSYCNLSPVAVLVWHSELSRTQRSECAVHRVHGLTRSSALRKISKLDNQLHCVEDVINIIANITDGTVTYLSSLNMPTFPLATARNQSWANIEEINDDISDIHRVLTAFQGADGVQVIFITGLNYPSEGSSTASVAKYLKLKRLNYQASLVMLLNSCLNAHSDEDFADAVENLHSVATAFLQDYSASLLQFRLVDTPYGDPSRLSKTSIRSKYILRILYLNALHDTGFISGDGGIDQLRCPSVLSICSGMHRSRRELLVRFMLSALLPSSQYLDSSGDVIIQRHWSMHIAASVTLSLPAAMWNPPAEALHNFRLCRSSCKAGTNFEISAADNRMSRELTTACPDLLRVLSLAAKIILYKAADASTDFTVSILDFNALEWSQHVHSVMNTKLSLPLYDKYGSGPYGRDVEMACRAGTDITDRFINGNRCIGTAISMVYVLVFVSSTDEFAAAQSHVHEWKERERIRSNLYIRYFIIVAPASGHGSNSVSMRYILIFLEQWINDFATNFDVVVALNGLLGAQAFRAPRPTEGRRGPGIAPYLQEDQDSACIKMFAPIVFSRISTLDMGINDGLQCPFDMNQSLNRAHGCSDEMELVDVRAFAGTVDHLRAMLNHILRRDILFMLKINAEVNLDDQHVICSLKRFAIIHPYLVGVDVNRSYFDHNKETQDKPFKSNRALSALARLATVVPIRHCSFPQYSETIENAIIGLIEEDTKMVNESKLSEIDSVGFNALLNNELCFSLGLSWRAFELLRYTPQYWVPVARLYWCAIAAPMVSFNISLEEKKAAIHFLSAQLKVLNTNDALDLPFRGLSRMIHLYMSALYQEIGPYHLAAKHFSLSADAALYEDVEIKRLLWSQQRQSYKNYLSQRLRETLAMPKITRKNSVKSVEEQDWMAKIGIRRNGRDVLARNRARYASYCDSSLAKESGDAAKRCGVVLDDEVIPMRKPQIHVYTLATERRPGLDYLEFAANIAGIKLKVVGMGHKWNGFSDTVPLFRQALLKDTDVDDNDIIFLIDAYDVIIFPALRNAIKVFSESPTPVLMCTEIGLHPEQLGGILYRRGDDSDPAEFGIRFGDKEQPPRRVARFVNGGCAAGRAAQLKELFTSDTIWPHIFYRDDQMDQGRFIMSNPHIASLDDDRELFFTAYKENTNVLAKIATDFGFEMNRHHHRYIGILHCNGGSLPLCESVILGIKAIYDQFYTGNYQDAATLLSAMRLYWEGDYHGTIQLINSLSFYKNESHSNASMIFESSDNLIARKMAAEFIMGMVQNDLTDIKGN